MYLCKLKVSLTLNKLHMKTRKLKVLCICAAVLLAGTAEAQILNKLKNAAEKVNKVAKALEDDDTSAEKSSKSTEKSSDASNKPAKSTGSNVGMAYKAVVSGNGKTVYVSRDNGNNRNDGSKASPYKNLQKALDEAPAGSVIMVAEGNYYGMLNCGNINITKPVTIMGGYSSDFSKRDILTYRTMIQPTSESNGSHTLKGTITLTSIVAPNDKVVLDGLIIDRGNTVSYNKNGKGQPQGVQSAQMNPIGTEGVGGEGLNEKTFTKESSQIYFNGEKGVLNNTNIIIRNCAFLNAPNYAILGLLKAGSLTVENCIFVNVRMSTMDVRGSDPKVMTPVTIRNNTMLFTWSRLKDLASMGYGYRMQPGTCNTIERNIIGCSVFSGLDRTHIDSDKNREALRKDYVNDNIFFLNRQTDLTLPGGGMLLRVKCNDFDDIEQLAGTKGNKSLTDPKVFDGKIDKAYLEGFINLEYKESYNADYNSSANTFRQAMGLNMTGTMTSEGTMFANRYPWQEALKLFGAMSGYGAQLPK